MGLYQNSPENLQAFQKAMNDLTSGWKKLYEAALLELDRDKLLMRIEAAEQAIHARARAIEGSGNDYGEAQAIEDALHALSLLRRSSKE